MNSAITTKPSTNCTVAPALSCASPRAVVNFRRAELVARRLTFAGYCRIRNGHPDREQLLIVILTFVRWVLFRLKSQNKDLPPADPSPSYLIGLPLERFIKLASQLVDLQVSRKVWRQRKVEAIEWRGESLYRRKVSIDFTMPDRSEFPEYWAAFEGHSDKTVVIPLSMMRKGVLHDFDLVDESRHPIPVCTREQHEKIAQAALLTRATKEIEDRGLGRTLDDDLQEQLVNIVHENNAIVASTLFDRFVDARALAPGTWHSDQRRALLDSAGFVQLLHSFAGQYLMCVFLAGLPGQRRVVKFAYEDQAGPSEARSTLFRSIRSWCQYIGWWPRVTHLGIGDTSAARSYHIEVAAPAELLIARADVREAVDTGTPLRSESLARRVHFYLTGSADLERLQSLDLEVHFALDPQGFLLSVMSVAITTFLLLATGVLLHINGIGLKQQDTAAVIVVAVPGLLAAVLFRSDEERLVAISIVGLRVIAGLLVAASLAAAGLLVVNVDSSTRFYGWCLSASIAGLAALATAVAWRLSSYWARVSSTPKAAGQAPPTNTAVRPRFPRIDLGALTRFRIVITAAGAVGLVGLAIAFGAQWPHLSLPSLQLGQEVWIRLAGSALFGVLVFCAVVSWLTALLGWLWRRSSPDVIQ